MTRRVLRYLAEVTIAVDPRSLGLFRILLGTTLLFDLLDRLPGIEHWYTAAGIIPTPLIRETGADGLFSLFFYADTTPQAALGMAACGLAYLAFALGVATRLSHLLALVAWTSISSRVYYLENGGYWVTSLLLVWSLFLPLGRRFSIDALVREAHGGDAHALAPVHSLAVLFVRWHLAAVYLFNVLHKTGELWRDGSAVHYVLHDERMNTIAAVWLRELVPPVALAFVTHATLWIEAAAVVLIVTPVCSRSARAVAVCVLPALHLSFTACLELGPFSRAMISFYPLLLAPAHWDFLAARFGHLVPTPAAERLAVLPSFALPRGGRVVGRIVAEACAVVLAVSVVGELSQSNDAWPTEWRWRQPLALNRVVWYPRMLQYWNMFAPQPPREVVAIAVEAETVDGRVVDPYNEVASRVPVPRLSRDPFPERLNQDQLFSDFTKRLPQERFKWFRAPFGKWILRHAERTGRPEDRVVRARVYEVTVSIPPPGANGSGLTKRVLLFSVP